MTSPQPSDVSIEEFTLIYARWAQINKYTSDEQVPEKIGLVYSMSNNPKRKYVSTVLKKYSMRLPLCF